MKVFIVVAVIIVTICLAFITKYLENETVL